MFFLRRIFLQIRLHAADSDTLTSKATNQESSRTANPPLGCWKPTSDYWRGPKIWPPRKHRGKTFGGVFFDSFRRAEFNPALGLPELIRVASPSNLSTSPVRNCIRPRVPLLVSDHHHAGSVLDGAILSRYVVIRSIEDTKLNKLVYS